MKLKRGHLNNQGKFVSYKMQRTVVWKSLLEFDYIHLLELDSEVKKYENCEFKLTYSYQRQEQTIHPHFIVQRNKESFLTYLLNSKRKTEDQTHQFKILSNLCRQKEYILEVIPEEEIRRQPRLSNAKIIIKYATKSLQEPAPRLLCYSFFKDKPFAKLKELELFFNQNSASKRDIFRLIYHGVLSIDINQSIRPDSLINLLA